MLLKIILGLITLSVFSFIPATAQTTNAAGKQEILDPEMMIGRWSGPLKVNDAVSLTLALNIFYDDKQSISATLDSVDQNAFGITVDPFSITDTMISGRVPSIGASFEFEITNGSLVGTFTQGIDLPLILERRDEAEAPKQKPQEAALVRDYIIEEVSFSGGADGVVLAGELTKPKGEGPFPAVVLITGSGPQDRDEALLGHKPFLILSDHLTNQGFAVLRYDDRGVGASTGDFATATTFDFADDAAAALTFLTTRSDIDPTRLGYIGHSEGGLVAPLAHKQKAANYAILLASPTEGFADTIIRQTSDILRINGETEDVIEARRIEQLESFEILSGKDSLESKESNLRSFLSETGLDSDEIDRQVLAAINPWFIEALDYNPIPDLEAMNIPVFGVFAETDLQVSAAVNAPTMEAALRHPKSKVVTLEGLNHLFQPSETGAPSEYATLDVTFDPSALLTVSTWVKNITQPD
ncbi:MAG: alpha/beta fold hydrolase [Pseudomonadota bacterium]